MAAESKKKFQIVFSEEAQTVSVKSDLSPEISPIDMEIRWFKEKDCVCFYKNKRLIKGRNYGNTHLPTEELKRGNVFLPLIDISESNVGDYLCQLTYGGTTDEITLSLKPLEGFQQTEKSQQLTKPWKQIDKEWTDKERIKMAESALLAVFSTLEKRDQQDTGATMQINSSVENEEDEEENLDNQQPGPSEKKEVQKDLQDKNAPVLQANIKVETQNGDKDSRQEDTSTQESEKTLAMETSTSQQDKKENLDNPQLACSEGVSVFTILAGKTSDCHKKFIADLQNRIKDLREVRSVEESDIVLLFCPIVSRAGTDIDAALAKISYPKDSKLTVLVVLHHTYDPEKTVSDSSRCVNVENLLTVDCLFNEDEGLLKCQKNSAAFVKSVNWLIAKGQNMGVTSSQNKPHGSILSKRKKQETSVNNHNVQPPPTGNTWNNKVMIDQGWGVELVKRHGRIKMCSVLAGKTNNSHTQFIALLKTRIEDLREVRTVDESDIVLIFCPVVSKAGTDIDAALRRCYTDDSKLTVLVVLHHTFDPEKTVLDSSRCVTRKEILTVDCLFYEDEGLLKCPKNSAAYNKSVDWLIQQGNETGLKIYPKQNKLPSSATSTR